MENKSYILPSRPEFKAPASRAAMVDLAGLCHKHFKKSSNDEAYGLLEQSFLDQVFLGSNGVCFERPKFRVCN